jgi:chaperone required for assembly of F1-ATPase
MKRFYKQVSIVAVDGGHAIRLDGRAVKTPARAELVLPTIALARAAAAEWDAQVETIDPVSMPQTGLANAAIDKVAADHDTFVRDIAVYGETDLLCYRADGPEPLIERQTAIWDPLLAWAKTRYAIDFAITTGIIHRPQPPETIARLAAAVRDIDPFPLVALQRLVTISGSLVIGLAMRDGAIDARAAFDAAHLDELWQAELWGEDWMATDARDARRRDFEAAARFMALLV